MTQKVELFSVVVLITPALILCSLEDVFIRASIPFEEIENQHKWNIEHVWPLAKVKDDSLDNKVLVE